MKFNVKGNFLSNEVIKSRKSGEEYRVIKVLVGDDTFTSFADINIKINDIEYLENINIYFELTTYNNNLNLNILAIEKIK